MSPRSNRSLSSTDCGFGGGANLSFELWRLLTKASSFELWRLEVWLPVGPTLGLLFGKFVVSNEHSGASSIVEYLLGPPCSKIALPPPCNVFEFPELGLEVDLADRRAPSLEALESTLIFELCLDDAGRLSSALSIVVAEWQLSLELCLDSVALGAAVLALARDEDRACSFCWSHLPRLFTTFSSGSAAAAAEFAGFAPKPAAA